MNDLHRAAATAVLAAAGPWGGHSNGNIDLSLLSRLSWGNPQYLRPDAARALESLNVAYRARFGKNIYVTDAYRTLEAQKILYAQKPNKAAKPGTSNHGWGLAVDLGEGVNNFGTAQHIWMVANGPAYGWIHPPWARQGGNREEAWHFEYEGTTTNPPTSEEDDMTPEQAAQLTRIHDMIAVTGQPYGYPQAILNDIRAVARDVTTIQATLNVPGQPFAYPAATHNAVGGLIQRVTALQAAVADLSPSTGS